MRYANEDRHVASPADSIKIRMLVTVPGIGNKGDVLVLSASVARELLPPFGSRAERVE
jgi:hypothetical protein